MLHQAHLDPNKIGQTTLMLDSVYRTLQLNQDVERKHPISIFVVGASGSHIMDMKFQMVEILNQDLYYRLRLERFHNTLLIKEEKWSDKIIFLTKDQYSRDDAFWKGRKNVYVELDHYCEK